MVGKFLGDDGWNCAFGRFDPRVLLPASNGVGIKPDDNPAMLDKLRQACQPIITFAGFAERWSSISTSTTGVGAETGAHLARHQRAL